MRSKLKALHDNAYKTRKTYNNTKKFRIKKKLEKRLIKYKKEYYLMLKEVKNQ